jgi:hypothetical protein
MSLGTERLNCSVMDFHIQSLASMSNSPASTILEPSWNAVTEQFIGTRFSGTIYEILSRTISNCAANVIAWLIHFAFNEIQWLGKYQLEHGTLWKEERKKRETVPVGTVGCRRYNSYIYTECIGNNSRGGGWHRCWPILSTTLLYKGENKWWWERAGSSCKEIHVSTAQDLYRKAVHEWLVDEH